MYAVHAKKVLLYLKGRMDEGRVCPPFEFFCNVLLTESRVFRRRQTAFAAMPAKTKIIAAQRPPSAGIDIVTCGRSAPFCEVGLLIVILLTFHLSS